MKTSLNYLLIIAIVLGLVPNAISQSKKAIDLHAIDQWTSVNPPSISPDGKFAAYITENLPTGYQTLAVCATEGSWKIEIISKDFHYNDVQFTKDSRYCVFRADDTLNIVSLASTKITTISGVDEVALLKGTSSVLIYTTKKNSREKVVLNVSTNEVLSRINCDQYTASPNGRYLVYSVNDTAGNSNSSVKIHWYDLEDLSDQVIWEGKAAGNFVFDSSGNKLAFTGSDVAKERKCLLFYQRKAKIAEVIACANDLPLAGNFIISSLNGFTRDGTMLYFTATEKQATEMPSPTKAKVDVWNFNDLQLQSQQRKPINSFLMVSHLTNRKIYKLCPSDGLFFDPLQNFSDKVFLSKTNTGGDENDAYWNKTALETKSIVFASTGRTKVIDSGLTYHEESSYIISPSAEFILYYDGKLNDYCSYNIQTGKRTNLTNNIDAEWDYSFLKVQPRQSFVLRGLAGWVGNTNDVLLQSRYDIWRVRLDGSQKPICITKKYGEKHHIEFAVPSSPGYNNDHKVFKDDKAIYVSAFDPVTKQNGFFIVDVTGIKEPQKLIMEDYCYFTPWTVHELGSVAPVKADIADAWLVGRQRSDESVNYFFTKDFKAFTPITDNYPEKKYNWLSSELVNWMLPDGSSSQGILYKPENFDPGKKYPVIFLYYEELSNNLHVYMKPERATCDINIPYYVSNGYLVFTPDIKRTKSGAGQDALNTMESAAKYLSALPYVDPARLGLCGTSMGGYKTDFIITHSHLFAAANANADVSNVASLALDIWPDPNDGASLYPQVEVYQFYLGYTIAERPDLYVKSSPVFYINNVHTPLLIQHNKKDGGSPWDQGLAMFNAMRREGKPVWMLQYDGQDHFLDDRDTIVTTDFTIRQKQFFDHYLMGKPAPVWMTKGIPAWRKGIDDGLELDTTIKTPAERLLTPAEKARQTKKHVPVSISL